MPTFNPAPFDPDKPESKPAIPSTAAQRGQHVSGNTAFTAAHADVAALEGKTAAWVLADGTNGMVPLRDSSETNGYKNDWPIVVGANGTAVAGITALDFINGTNTTVTVAQPDAQLPVVTVRIDAAGGGAGEANTGANAGLVGEGIFKNKTGVTLNFKRLSSAQGNIAITASGADNVDLEIAPNGSDGQIMTLVSGVAAWANPPSGSGDVVGGDTSVDNEYAVYSGTGGKLLKALGKLIQEGQNLISQSTGSGTFGLILKRAGQSLSGFMAWNHDNEQLTIGVAGTAAGFIQINTANSQPGCEGYIDGWAYPRASLVPGGRPGVAGGINAPLFQQNGIGVVYPTDRVESGTGIALDFDVLKSPRVVCTNAAALTITAPAAGVGSLELVIVNDVTVAPAGFSVVRGTDPGGAGRCAYVTRTSTGATILSWGA